MVYNSSRIQEMCAHSSADRVPGYEPVGRRFKSCWARHEKAHICLRQMWVLFSEVFRFRGTLSMLRK